MARLCRAASRHAGGVLQRQGSKEGGTARAACDLAVSVAGARWRSPRRGPGGGFITAPQRWFLHVTGPNPTVTVDLTWCRAP